MKGLNRLSSGSDQASILECLDRDGAVIVEDLISNANVEKILGELGSYIHRTVPLDNDFSGHQTTRTGGLVQRSEHVRKLITEGTILGIARSFLEPFCDRIQLNLTQIIRLLAGQGAQELHRDRFIWGRYLPREIETQLNTISALTKCTEENGATQVVPGSHRWDWDREARPDEIVTASMRSGSVLIYTGSVIHGAGHNRSSADRIVLNLTFTLGWLRQEENQYLSCPPSAARDYDIEIQELLGYTMGNYALGYFSPPEFAAGAPDTLPPEFAVGREVGFDEPEDTF